MFTICFNNDLKNNKDMRVFWGVIHKVFIQIFTLCPLLFSPGMVAWINYDHIKERDLVGKFAHYINFTF